MPFGIAATAFPLSLTTIAEQSACIIARDCEFYLSNLECTSFENLGDCEIGFQRKRGRVNKVQDLQWQLEEIHQGRLHLVCW